MSKLAWLTRGRHVGVPLWYTNMATKKLRPGHIKPNCNQNCWLWLRFQTICRVMPLCRSECLLFGPIFDLLTYWTRSSCYFAWNILQHIWWCAVSGHIVLKSRRLCSSKTHISTAHTCMPNSNVYCTGLFHLPKSIYNIPKWLHESRDFNYINSSFESVRICCYLRQYVYTHFGLMLRLDNGVTRVKARTENILTFCMF